MPAPSPSCRSARATLKPFPSHHRRYIRRSISPQSCASVPPAPAWIVRMAFRSSSSPLSMLRNSRSPIPCSTRPRSASISEARDSSFDSSASSRSDSESPPQGVPPVDPFLPRADHLHHLLRGDIVVPELGRLGLLLELPHFFFLGVDVKDTPGESAAGPSNL